MVVVGVDFEGDGVDFGVGGDGGRVKGEERLEWGSPPAMGSPEWDRPEMEMVGDMVMKWWKLGDIDKEMEEFLKAEERLGKWIVVLMLGRRGGPLAMGHRPWVRGVGGGQLERKGGR